MSDDYYIYITLKEPRDSEGYYIYVKPNLFFFFSYFFIPFFF